MKHKNGMTEFRLASRQFYSLIREGDKTMDVHTITIDQNMEAPEGNHYKIALFLDRWRTKEQLVAYLRFAADLVERI